MFANLLFMLTMHPDLQSLSQYKYTTLFLFHNHNDKRLSELLYYNYDDDNNNNNNNNNNSNNNKKKNTR